MQLPRTTVCTLFSIGSPMWFGGQKKVGLNIKRIGLHNEIEFTYRRKSDGALSIPDRYYFNGDQLNEVDYERQNRKGVTLVLIPFSDLEILERV